MKPADLQQLVSESIKSTFEKSGPTKSQPKKKPAKPLKESRVKSTLGIIKEAIVTLPKGFLLKTEKLSARTKEAHEVIYKKYVDLSNKSSSELDGVSREEANSLHSAYKNVSCDLTKTLNGVKFHELYFSNISDLASEISMDSVPYIKLSRNFGTFEKWQYDFIATCMSSCSGWAMTVFDPYKNVYMNVIVDGDTVGLPLGAIPVIVMDMHEHAFYKDYADDKKSYIVAMMRELNWNVIEARMTVAERANLHDLWKIMPLVNSQPEAMLSAAEMAEPTPVEPVPAHAAQNQQDLTPR